MFFFPAIPRNFGEAFEFTEEEIISLALHGACRSRTIKIMLNYKGAFNPVTLKYCDHKLSTEMAVCMS